MPLRLLYQDDCVIAIDKPAGFHVHPPEPGEDGRKHRIPAARSCLHVLRDQVGSYLYPVHRIDAATSGVVLFALDPGSAAELQRQFAGREISKHYIAVTRGWVDEAGAIDSLLDGAESTTTFNRLGTVDLPVAVGKHPTSRYSLVSVAPRTGRMHQIRRHFAHLRHPLIGDTIYGDGKHNRFFREKIPSGGLFLKAYSIRFRHPRTGSLLAIRSRWNRPWLEAFDLFGICPYEAELSPP